MSAHRAACHPMMRLERLLWDLGYSRVAGVDEAGLGPLAGPVIAAAVVFEPGAKRVLEVDDSKKLTARRREELEVEIREEALAVGCGVVEVDELDRIGIYQAGHEAMRRALEAIEPAADYALVDARTVPGVEFRQSAYTKADTFIYSVAAASIIAKVTRDELMRELDQRYPGYDLGRHMGYGTAAHLAALEQLGPSPVHRRSFAPVRRLLAGDRTEGATP